MQSKEAWDQFHEEGLTFGLDADFTEWGTLPLDQKVKGLKVIADKYADTIAKAKKNQISSILPEHQLRYYKTIKAIAEDAKEMPNDLEWENGETPNLWIHGPAGIIHPRVFI